MKKDFEKGKRVILAGRVWFKDNPPIQDYRSAMKYLSYKMKTPFEERTVREYVKKPWTSPSECKSCGDKEAEPGEWDWYPCYGITCEDNHSLAERRTSHFRWLK